MTLSVCVCVGVGVGVGVRARARARARACVRACVGGWVGGWVGVCVCVLLGNIWGFELDKPPILVKPGKPTGSPRLVRQTHTFQDLETCLRVQNGPLSHTKTKGPTHRPRELCHCFERPGGATLWLQPRKGALSSYHISYGSVF